MKVSSQKPCGTGEHAIRFKMRLGLLLCAVYAAAYAGFVAIAVYDVALMDMPMPLELNLGVFYGFGLIVLAFLLSLVYNLACTLREKTADILFEGFAAPSMAVETEEG